jgi:hypothetical protein
MTKHLRRRSTETSRLAPIIVLSLGGSAARLHLGQVVLAAFCDPDGSGVRSLSCQPLTTGRDRGLGWERRELGCEVAGMSNEIAVIGDEGRSRD